MECLPTVSAFFAFRPDSECWKTVSGGRARDVPPGMTYASLALVRGYVSAFL